MHMLQVAKGYNFRALLDVKIIPAAGLLEEIPIEVPTVAIKTFHGTYLTAMPPCDEGPLRTASTSIDKLEMFEVVLMSGGKVALRTHHGTYITAQPQRSQSAIRTGAANIGPWEKFQVVSLPGGKVAFYTHHGTYLSVFQPSTNGSVRTDSLRIDDLQLFTFESTAEVVGVSKVFALKTSYKTFLTANEPSSHQGGPLLTEARFITDNEQFEVFQECDKGGRFALETHFGDFLSVKEPLSKGAVHTSAKTVSNTEKFQFIYLANSRVAIRTLYGTYLSALAPGTWKGEGSVQTSVVRGPGDLDDSKFFHVIVQEENEEGTQKTACCAVS